jgi:hypothetical protein
MSSYQLANFIRLGKYSYFRAGNLNDQQSHTDSQGAAAPEGQRGTIENSLGASTITTHYWGLGIRGPH